MFDCIWLCGPQRTRCFPHALSTVTLLLSLYTLMSTIACPVHLHFMADPLLRSTLRLCCLLIRCVAIMITGTRTINSYFSLCLVFSFAVDASWWTISPLCLQLMFNSIVCRTYLSIMNTFPAKTFPSRLHELFSINFKKCLCGLLCNVIRVFTSNTLCVAILFSYMFFMYMLCIPFPNLRCYVVLSHFTWSYA